MYRLAARHTLVLTNRDAAPPAAVSALLTDDDDRRMVLVELRLPAGTPPTTSARNMLHHNEITVARSASRAQTGCSTSAGAGVVSLRRSQDHQRNKD